MTKTELDAKSDEEITKIVQTEDAQAFGVLVERYEQKLRRYARKFLFIKADTEDLVQEIFIKAYVNIRGFNSSMRFSPWIYRIAHNHFINALKKRKNEPRPILDPETIFPHPIAPQSADDKIKKTEEKLLIEQYLQRLKPKYRDPLMLYYLEELSYQEVADVLKIPVKTVGVRLNRAKAQIQEIVKNENQKVWAKS